MAATNATQDEPIEAARIESLLRRERKRFSTYWTLFQEMGIRGELPAWLQKSYPDIGKHEDWDAQDADQAQTDKALTGGSVPSKYSFSLDTENNAFIHNREGWLVFEGTPSELPAKHPDALFEFTPSQLQMYAYALRCETLGRELAHG